MEAQGRRPGTKAPSAPKRLSVRRDDQVLVRSGKDRGKRGKVLHVDRERGRVLVEGVNIVRRHQKATAAVKQAGIIEKPAPISASAVMVICSACKKPTRIGHTEVEGRGRVRKCMRCGEPIG